MKNKMENKIVVPQDIAQEANQYGIEPSKAINLLSNLPQITSERDVLSSQYDEIIKMDIEDVATSKLARELRIKIKDNRTKGIAIWHKTAKDYFLKGGQFVDAIKRKEEAVNVRMEETLEQIEKYAQIKKEKAEQELRTKRNEELAPYRDFVPFGIDFGVISDEEFMKVYNGAKLQQEAKDAADKKAAEERAEKERLEMVKAEKINKLMPYYQYIKNYESIDFDSVSDEEVNEIIEKAKVAKDKAQKEAEEAKKRAEQAEKELKEEKAKREKIEAELAEKKRVEEKRLADEKEKERKLKNASDKVILLDIASKIETLHISFPKVKGNEAKEAVNETIAYLTKIANYVKGEAESLTK